MLSTNAFFTPLTEERELVTALEDWSRVVVALEVLGATPGEEEAFWLVLSININII